MLRTALALLAVSAVPALAADTSRQLIGRTATMSLEVDGEAEADQGLAGLGFDVIQPPRTLAADRFPTYRIEVLSGGPDGAGQTTIVVWRLERPVDKLKGEWKITGALRAKVGSEAAFSDSCPGNAKDKPALTFVFHEGGSVGGPVKDVLAVMRLDRQSGKLERVAGKAPACKVTEETFSEG